MNAERLDELVEILGTHAREAAAWDKAASYFRRAAQKAIDRFSHSRAITFIDGALHALAKSSLDATAMAEGELELRLLLRTAFNAIGNYRDRLSNLDRAELLAQRLGRRVTLPSLWVSRASAILQLGQVRGAMRLCARALRAASLEREYESSVIAGYMLSRTYFYAGRFVISLATAECALSQLRERPHILRHGGGFGSSQVMLLTQITQTRACLGDFTAGLNSAAEALSAAEQSRRSFDIALASYGFGILYFYAGDPTLAIDVLERGQRLRLARRCPVYLRASRRPAQLWIFPRGQD